MWSSTSSTEGPSTPLEAGRGDVRSSTSSTEGLSTPLEAGRGDVRSSTSSTEGPSTPLEAGRGDVRSSTSSTEGPSTPLEAGRVGRAHGLDGSFYVTSARPRLLSEGGEVTVAGQTRRIVRRAGVEQRPIVRLAGVEDRSAVEALRGQPLTIARTQAPALGAGEWWAHELEGCAVRDGERSLGTVSGLLELPSCEALRVRREDGGELLVPLVRDAIRNVDIAARSIDVSLDFLGEA